MSELLHLCGGDRAFLWESSKGERSDPFFGHQWVLIERPELSVRKVAPSIPREERDTERAGSEDGRALRMRVSKEGHLSGARTVEPLAQKHRQGFVVGRGERQREPSRIDD